MRAVGAVGENGSVPYRGKVEQRLAHMVTNIERSKQWVLLLPTIGDLLPETRFISERPITFKLSLSANGYDCTQHESLQDISEADHKSSHAN